jgi:tetratricopeptide (TPR) repeat protein
MKKWIFIATILTVVGTAKSGAAQTQHSPDHGGVSGSFQPSSTPAWKAKYHKVAVFARAATAAMQSGDYAEAEANARAAVATGYDAGFAQETLAAALDAQGKSQEALQAYKEIANEGGNDPRNLLPYAQLLLKAGDWSGAVSAYNKALPLLDNGDMVRRSSDFAPNVPNPTALAAAIHTALGLQSDWRGYHGTYQEMTQQSLVHFQQAAALEPNSPVTNYYVGYGLMRLGRRAEAQAAFKKAAALGQGYVREAAQKELPETMRPK